MQIKQTITGTEPVSLTEVKTALKVDYNDEDSYLSLLISSARKLCEDFTGRSFIAKTVELFVDEIPDEILLPFPDHNAVVEVKLNDVVSTAYTKTGFTQFIIRPSIIDFNTIVDNYGFYVKYTTIGTDNELVKEVILKAVDEAYRNRGNTFEGSITKLSENSYAKLAGLCVM